MVFSKKAKGYFVEHNSHSVLLAVTSARSGPMVVEDLHLCPASSPEAVAEIVKQLNPKKSGQQSYLHSTCGVYTGGRLVRHVSLDSKRFKESAYMDDVLANQVRVEADKYTLALLAADNGQDFDFTSSTKKDAVVVGMPSAEIIDTQKSLLENGIYPDRLEVGTLATLGGLVDYLKFKQIKTPTLVLEIDNESTQSFIVSSSGVENSRPIAQGLEAMIPAVQKEIGLKDPEAAKKLFFSNAFDFTAMGPLLIKKLLKELQSSVGFYEVQTGQSIGQVVCTMLPPKLGWLENTISTQLGVPTLPLDLAAWLQARGITLAEAAKKQELNNRWLGLFSLMLNFNHVVAA